MVIKKSLYCTINSQEQRYFGERFLPVLKHYYIFILKTQEYNFHYLFRTFRRCSGRKNTTDFNHNDEFMTHTGNMFNESITKR